MPVSVHCAPCAFEPPAVPSPWLHSGLLLPPLAASLHFAELLVASQSCPQCLSCSWPCPSTCNPVQCIYSRGCDLFRRQYRLPVGQQLAGRTLQNDCATCLCITVTPDLSAGTRCGQAGAVRPCSAHQISVLCTWWCDMSAPAELAHLLCRWQLEAEAQHGHLLAVCCCELAAQMHPAKQAMCGS